MLPIPTIDYIPKIFKDRADAETLAFTNKMDSSIAEWFLDVNNLSQLLDTDRCPEVFLGYLGNMLNAGIQTSDSERTKRQKVYSAIQTHKRRGSWVAHAKLVIDAITGYNSVRYVLTDEDDWILTGDGDVELTTSWAILGGDGTAPYGMALVGDGTEVEVWGNIYIDLHYGVHTAVLTSDQITQIINDIATDIVPAYVRVYLGFVPVGGGFETYSGGVIS